jgi:DNA-3-methyladenine glycosylase
MEPLSREFFSRRTREVAPDLLGRFLVRGDLVGRIVETEAYLGPTDRASHARTGRTQRNAAMFGPVGHAYVYFTYGIHWMLNVTARRNESAGAVLLRAVEPVSGVELMRERRGGGHREYELTNGPAKLCQAFDVTGALDGADLCDPAAPLYIAGGEPELQGGIESGSRIGIDYAESPWRERPLRFWIRGNRFVSR